jgi:hypothetical protein
LLYAGGSAAEGGECAGVGGGLEGDEEVEGTGTGESGLTAIDPPCFSVSNSLITPAGSTLGFQYRHSLDEFFQLIDCERMEESLKSVVVLASENVNRDLLCIPLGHSAWQ